MSKKDTTLATNRKARHEYFIEDSLEVGMVLKGTEVKSIRQGRVNIGESYAVVENGEIYIYNMHISPYEQGNIQNVDPLRKRKLLLHKRQILKLSQEVAQKGKTLIPLKLYLNRGRVKLELAVAKGKKLHDKRETIARKDAKRQAERELKDRYF